MAQDFISRLEEDVGIDWTVYKLEYTSSTPVEIQSSAYQLQDTVATWYKALRAIALVGLLSVLVYVGIRIIISSTGQEKAKYKKMIIDWVAAICIVFILQYIMVFITTITQKITDVLSVSITGEEGEDILMSNLRNQIGDAYDTADFSTLFAQTVMYLALVIFTVMFTIQYLKRLLYMAFFTMIAPLIALTYPLDKIKDGQAQAFGMWIREYTFNALLQPMHLLLYYMFVQSATSLVNSNPLYAITAIGFLLPAEKFFRKMFGFDKAASANPLGAAAGGALIMNAVNKMGQKAGQAAAAAGSNGSSGGHVRTASSNGVTVGSTGGNGSLPGGSNPSTGGSNPLSGGSNSPTGGNGSSTGGYNPSAGGYNPSYSPSIVGNMGSTRTANTHGATMARALGQKRNIANGVRAVGRKYVNKNTAKKAGRMLRKGLVGAAGAVALGTVGVAAGVATGDLGNALKYGAAGAGAGYIGANNLGDSIVAGEKNLRETFKEGAIGQDEYNNLQSDKEFFESDDYRKMLNNHEIDDKLLKNMGVEGKTRNARMKNAVQAYRDSGITDTGKITAAMKLNLSPQEGAYAIKLAEMIGRSGYNNKNVREDFEKRYRSSIPAGPSGDRIWNSIESLL